MPVEQITRVSCDLEGCTFESDDPDVTARFVKLTAGMEDGQGIEGVYCSKLHAGAALNQASVGDANPTPQQPGTPEGTEEGPTSEETASEQGEERAANGTPEATLMEEVPVDTTPTLPSRVAQRGWLRVPRGSAYA